MSIDQAVRGQTVPGTNDGSFAPHRKSEADPAQVLSAEHPLAGFAGWAGRGYDSYDVARLNDGVAGHLHFRYARDHLEARRPGGMYRPLSAELERFLFTGRPGDPVPDALLDLDVQPHFEQSDRDYLSTHAAGSLAEGYTSDDIRGLARNVNGVQLAAVWERYEDDYTGDSEILGRVGDGPWRSLSVEAWEFLTEAEPGTEPPAQFLDTSREAAVIDLDTIAVMGPGRGNYVLA